MDFFKNQGITDYTEESNRQSFAWLLRVRWATIATQAFLLVSSRLIYHLDISSWLIASVVLVGIISNIFFYWLLKQNIVIPCWLPTTTLSLDLILLTIIHFHFISIFNPFNTLYIIYITLGAFLLDRKCSYVLTIFSIICYSIYFEYGHTLSLGESLLIEHQSLFPHPLALDFLRHLEAHLREFNYFMFVVFFLTAILIVVPVGTIKYNLEKHKKELLDLEHEKQQNEKLATLTTFAAGAAHELSTPLSTIAVVANDMLAQLKQHEDPEMQDDARLIREQVQRAKEILDQMSADCGEELGDQPEEFRLKELIGEIIGLFYLEHLGISIQFINEIDDMHIIMPGQSLTRSVHSLLKNAIDASKPGSSIILTCRKDAQFLYIEVRDQGTGMEEEVLEKATEPFFTTKEPGSGMGLGLFLTRTMAGKFDGGLKLESKSGLGTTATLYFGLESIQAFYPGLEERTSEGLKQSKALRRMEWKNI